MTEPSALLPCPFCGNRPTPPFQNLRDDEDDVVKCWTIQHPCTAIDHEIWTHADASAEECAKVWNTRAAPASEPVAWEELVEDCAKIAEGHVGMYAGTDASEDTVKAYDEACRDVAEAIRNEHGVDVDAATGTADDQDFR